MCMNAKMKQSTRESDRELTDFAADYFGSCLNVLQQAETIRQV